VVKSVVAVMLITVANPNHNANPNLTYPPTITALLSHIYHSHPRIPQHSYMLSTLVTCRCSGREADALKIDILTPNVQPLLEHDNRGSLNNRSR